MPNSPPNPFASSNSVESASSQYAEYRQPTSSSRSPSAPSTPQASEDTRFISQNPASPLAGEHGQRTIRPSPLNPSLPPSFSSANSRRPMNGSAASTSSRPPSRSSSTQHFIPSKQRSDDPFSPQAMATLGLGPSTSSFPGLSSTRGSMILYRLADDPASLREPLVPPRFGKRGSIISSSGDSIISFSSDSKYPMGAPQPRGLVPYAYDPELDMGGPPDEDDMLHDPKQDGYYQGYKASFPWRGILNVSVLLLIIFGLLVLFAFYPIFTHYQTAARDRLIDGNTRINGTGQSPVLIQMPQLIDPETPDSAKTRPGWDGEDYALVFSDEFNTDGRSFYPGDDPFWEAVDLWYGSTGDLEWYDPSQVTTRDGHLILTIDSTTTTQAGLTRGSTAPFTLDENHQLNYRSGMIQSWNKFCFTSGYIEVSVTLPGPDENTAGYWPGAWTMGNLARPGYAATTDGMWPYTYDSCDLGTFPNQTNPDGQTPPAAIFSSASRAQYNNELSWLSGQRTSACSCPGSDHPGPQYNIGRGAPEIDIFEASKDKINPTGGTVSQSAQFGPFSHDYTYLNATSDEWYNYNNTRTRANPFHGSAVQQSVSAITKLPSDIFQGSGQNFKTLGFEYYGNPNNRAGGYVTWQVDGQRTHRVGAGAVVADPEPGGSGVSARLIPEEPMSIVLNLGISSSWQPIDLSTMIFPGEMLIDYVRVYQRKDEVNIGCDPVNYPTAKYIQDHIAPYLNPNITEWSWPKPRNSLYEGGC